jgi:hypothetical protein
MRSKSFRLTVAGLVAVLSVIGLSQAPAGAKVISHHHAAKQGGPLCC